MNVEKNNRTYRVDVLRVLCIWWVVCIAHMDEYARIDLSNSLITACNKIVLSILFYISGWCCRNLSFNTKKDIVSFFIKKFKRIYPLYFLALVSMVIISYLFGYDYAVGRSEIIGGIWLVGAFVAPSLTTLYYINILAFFYMISPILKSNSKKRIVYLIVILFFLISMKICGIFDIDYRVIYYLPCYFAGLNESMFSKENKFWTKRKCYIVMILSFIGNIYLLEHGKIMHKWIWEIIVTWLLGISGLAVIRPEREFYCVKYKKMIDFFSYSSFCVYLFHRQIISTIYFVGGTLNIFVAYGIVFPALIILGFFIQKTYDEILLKCRR